MGRRPAIGRDGAVILTLQPVHGGEIGIAQPDRQFDQGIEHALQIESRTADEIKHVAAGGLLLHQFPQFMQQPRILDRDDRLIGKAGNELDLPLCERTDLVAADRERADQLVVLQQRDGKRGSDAGFHGGDGRRIAFDIRLIGGEIGDVDQRFGRKHPGAGRMLIGTVGRASAQIGEGRRQIVGGDEMQRFAVPAIDRAIIGAADRHGVRQYGGEDRLQIAGRFADDMEDFQGPLLLPQVSFSSRRSCATLASRFAVERLAARCGVSASPLCAATTPRVCRLSWSALALSPSAPMGAPSSS